MSAAFERWALVRALLLVLLGAAGLAACRATHSSGPYAPQVEAKRDTALATELNARAADLLESDPEQAESLLRAALTADLYHGPAHNNLGVLYLAQGKLYEAAGEFEWAKKLLPGHPDPRVNLALTLESAGRTEEAFASYTAALEVYPGHLAAIQGLVKLCVQSQRKNSRLPTWLAEVALRGETPEWQAWARAQLASTPPTSLVDS